VSLNDNPPTEQRHPVVTSSGSQWVASVHHVAGPGPRYEVIVFADDGTDCHSYTDLYGTLKEALDAHDVTVAWARSRWP